MISDICSHLARKSNRNLISFIQPINEIKSYTPAHTLYDRHNFAHRFAFLTSDASLAAQTRAPNRRYSFHHLSFSILLFYIDLTQIIRNSFLRFTEYPLCVQWNVYQMKNQVKSQSDTFKTPFLWRRHFITNKNKALNSQKCSHHPNSNALDLCIILMVVSNQCRNATLSWEHTEIYIRQLLLEFIFPLKFKMKTPNEVKMNQ